MQFTRDLSQAQSQLFFVLNTFLQRYEPSELQPLIDEDVAEAAAALAATAETASRGLIYDHHYRRDHTSARIRRGNTAIHGRRRSRPHFQQPVNCPA